MNEEEKTTDDENNKKVNILIDVSPDKFKVYLTLVSSKEYPDFPVDEIRKAISEKGIIFGIEEEILNELERKIKFNERILIASGIRPVEGIDGEINNLFDSKETVKINKGEKICEILPPKDSVSGMTVYEEEVPAENGSEAQIPELINAEISPDDENYIISTIDGYLSIDLSSIAVIPFFELEKITDKYEAYVRIRKPLKDGDFTGDDIKQFLNENKIVFGILEDEIENIFQQQKFEQKVLIAKGERVIHGKNGEIKYYFETVVKPKKDEHGNVDYKELNLIQNVKKGKKIAEAIPPVDGVGGCTIFGKEDPPIEGVPVPLPMGSNTIPDLDNLNILIAEIDGNVMLKGNNVEVDPVFIVKEDVDFSTGNIDYIGSVIVNGDVKSGFCVKAKNDIQIDGVVEDAVIEAGGDVLLKAGFMGKGDGKIIAQGKVMVKFCENENIICNGDILIGDYVMNSNIQTKGNLFVTEQKGIIVGGEIYAVKGIEARVIGNQSYTPTFLFAGIDKEINDKINSIKEIRIKNKKNKTEIEKTLVVFAQRKLIKKSLSEDKKNLLKRLIETKEEIEEEEEKYKTEIEELENKIGEFKNVIIKIINWLLALFPYCLLSLPLCAFFNLCHVNGYYFFISIFIINIFH